MKKPFIGVYNLANCVTMLGVAAAVVGISFANNPRFAMLMLVLAGVCDMFDGRVARMFPRTDFEKKYGIQLDSFADTVSFVIFPAVFLIAQGRTVWTVLIAILYVFAGVTRLCWFDITTDGNTKYFSGFPVTCIALLLPMWYAVFALAHNAVPTLVVALSLLVMAVLFVANIRVKKPTGKATIVLAVVGLAMLLVLLLVR